MMNLSATLRTRAQGRDTAGAKPRLFDLSADRDRADLERLVTHDPSLRVHDTIVAQLYDFLRAREPFRLPTTDELTAWTGDLLGGRSPTEYGRWVYYPWSNRLVHVLPPVEFRTLRSDRNRYKITGDEQERLRSVRVGIAGLSVGLSVALTMALEGVGGSFRLADFDTLGLSNLNRLRAGVGDFGLNKAVLAARQMLELDPYLDIRIFPDGITEDNLGDFFTAGGPLDLLIEECDDLYAKVRLREEARRLRIPVLMNTSDRGLIDVERFDREPDRPLLHGLIGSLRADELKGLTTKEKIPFILKILDPSRLSPQSQASMVEIKETLETWPQLGSAVTLGGALTTDVARRVLLGQLTHSARFYVDLETLVRDGAEVELAEPQPEERPLLESRQPPPPIPRPSQNGRGGTSVEEMRYVVAHGLLAPSGGNAQPWRFVWKDGHLLAYLDTRRPQLLLDFAYRASYLAFGAVAENMDLAARDLGLRADIEPFPQPDNPLLVFRLGLKQDPSVTPEPELFEQIRLRVTNRRLGQRQPLADQERNALVSAAQFWNADLTLLTAPGLLDGVAVLLGRADRIRFLTEQLHRELMTEMRWTPSEVAATRDGLDISTLELSAADRAALEILANWPTLAYLRRIGGGQALEQPSRNAVAAASAVGLLTAREDGLRGWVQGGRAVQRVWLTASARGLALQPMTVLPYLFAGAEHGGGGLAAAPRRNLAELRREYLRYFPVPAGHAEVMLFRLARAEPPTARSLRRPIEEVVTIE
jgi:tRNA A37 threonylcarbamoyladenosine dehydratase/nitroreductase